MALTKESALRKDVTQPSNANFQHRHYAEIARIIRATGYPQERERLAKYFADELARNSNFDRARFMSACTVEA